MKRSDLLPRQVSAIELIKDKKRCCLFMKPGAGKTISTLTALVDLKPKKTLVLAPVRVCEMVWMQEAQKWEHTKHLTFSLVRGTEKQRIQALRKDADIYLINYELLPWLISGVVLEKHFEAIIYDEISFLKNPGSKRFRAIRNKIKNIPIRVGLTGTPTGNSYLNLWTELWLTAGPKPLGTSFVKYRSKHFVQVSDYVWKLTDPVPIKKAVKPHCFFFEGHKNKVDYVPVSVQQYEGGFPDMDHLPDGAILNKLRQIEGGAVYDENQKVVKLHDYKIKAVTELIEDNLLVFYEFKHEFDRLRKLGFTDDIKAWCDGKNSKLALHPKAAGHGLNLHTGGCNILFFTLPWSVELFEQSIGRLDRTGQERPVTVFYFSNLEIETYVFRSLMSKSFDQEELMRHVLYNK